MLFFHIDDDAALIAIEVDEGRRETRAFRTPGAPHRVALGRFDLDDIGAQVAEQLRAEGSRYDLGQIENSDTSERAVGHTFVSPIQRFEETRILYGARGYVTRG